MSAVADSPLAAADVVAKVHARECSAVELAQQALAAAEALDPAINPFTELLADRALAAAGRVDAAVGRGERPALAGVPLTVKESMWLEGLAAEMASPALRGHVAPATTTAIARLEAAGAIVFARTTTPELCRGFATDTEIHGRTCNPLDLERGVGASSGGAAAGLAAGVGCAALASDESGSIRLPAAFCGLVGHRPTQGAVPITPGFPQGAGMSTFGPLARSARDALLLLDAMAAGGGTERLGQQLVPDDARTPAHLAGSTFLASPDLGGRAPIGAAARERFGAVCAALAEAGATVLELPPLPDAGDAIFDWICADVSAHYAPLVEAPGGVGARVRRLIDLGAALPAPRLSEIEALRDELFAAYALAFESSGAVAVLTPTLGFEALRHDEAMTPELADAPGDPWAFLYEASLTGLPAVTIPMGVGEHGLPLGLQLMGRHRDDRLLLRLAQALEPLLS